MTWKPDYVTLTQAKDYLKVQASTDNALIQTYVTTACRAVDDHCNRQFGQLDNPASWDYRPYYDLERGVWVVEMDDVTDATGFAAELVDGGTAIDSYQLEPLRAVDQGKAYTQMVIKSDSAGQPSCSDDLVRITNQFGWTSTPVPATEAVQLQLARFSARRSSPFGIAGSPETGSELRLLSKLDPDAVIALKGYRRTRRLG